MSTSSSSSVPASGGVPSLPAATEPMETDETRLVAKRSGPQGGPSFIPSAPEFPDMVAEAQSNQWDQTMTVEDLLRHMAGLTVENIARVDSLRDTFIHARDEITRDVDGLIRGLYAGEERLSAVANSSYEFFQEQSRYNDCLKALLRNTWAEVNLLHSNLKDQLDVAFSECGEKLTAVEATVVGLPGSVEALQSEVDSLRKEVESLKVNAESEQSRLEFQKFQVTVEADIVSMKEELSRLRREKKVTFSEEDVPEVDVGTTVGALTEAVAKLDALLGQVGSRVDRVEEDFVDLVDRGQDWSDSQETLRVLVESQLGQLEEKIVTVRSICDTRNTEKQVAEKAQKEVKVEVAPGLSGGVVPGPSPFGFLGREAETPPMKTEENPGTLPLFPPLSLGGGSERVSTVGGGGSTVNPTPEDPYGMVRGLAALDPRLREVLGKTVPMPRFTGKGEDWDDFVLSWNRWWPLSGLPPVCKGEVFKETLPAEMKGLVDRLISRDGWTFDQIFGHLGSTYSGHRNRFTLKEKWEACKLHDRPTVLSFSTWLTEWHLLGKQVEGLTAQQVCDQFLRALPSFWVGKIVRKQRQKEEKGKTWGTVDEYRVFMEKELRSDEFVNMVRDQVAPKKPQPAPASVKQVSSDYPTKPHCSTCNRPGHTAERCWKAHPDQRDEYLKNVDKTRSRSAPARSEYKGKNRLSDEEVVELQKQNKCFWCKEVGHRARDCPKKTRK